MKKSVFFLLFLCILLTACGTKEPTKHTPIKEPAPVMTIEQKEEQQKQWEEEQKIQQQMNQDAVNTMTIMIPAIM